jgi:hypothetical protein
MSLTIHDPYQGLKTTVATNKFWLTTNFPHSIQDLASEVLIILLCHMWHKGNSKPHPKKLRWTQHSWFSMTIFTKFCSFPHYLMPGFWVFLMTSTTLKRWSCVMNAGENNSTVLENTDQYLLVIKIFAWLPYFQKNILNLVHYHVVWNMKYASDNVSRNNIKINNTNTDTKLETGWCACMFLNYSLTSISY